MPTRSSSAQWSGNLARGSGTMSLGSGALAAARLPGVQGVIPEAPEIVR